MRVINESDVKKHTPYVPLLDAYPVMVDGEIAGAVSVAGAETGETTILLPKQQQKPN